MNSPAAWELLVLKQYGVISRGQALKAGLTKREIDRRLASSQWEVLHKGVYAPRPQSISWHQRLMAAVLFGGSSAVASHRSAAALWTLEGLEERPVEISVKAGRRIRGAIVHRRRATDDPETLVIDGIPTTGIERTLLDVAAVVSAGRAALALDDALRRQLTTLESLQDLLSGPKGRVGTRALRQLVEARDDLDERAESRLESALLRLIRTHGLPKPIPQYRVVDGDTTVARLDFAYPRHRLGIEADGYRWHSGQERWRRDIRRENRLKLMGWTVLRFSWDDVHKRPGLVADQTRGALESLGSLSQLPFR